MYEIYQLIIKYLNKKTLCRLRTVSHEVRDYIKKPKPFKEEKLRRQRYNNIINNFVIIPKKYIYINKVVHHHSQIKGIFYKIGSETLYSLWYCTFLPPFDKKKEYYKPYTILINLKKLLYIY